MNPAQIRTRNLTLVPQTRDEVRTYVEQLPTHEKAEISPVWLARLHGSSFSDPWIHGFVMVHQSSGTVVGRCGFKGPPTDGVVELAYGVSPEHQGKGYATEAAAALVSYALSYEGVRAVRAHTLPRQSASTRVLTKCGFHHVGEVIDPEDGLVWRWERYKETG
jgi:RimJ/RimL family protein N-acetyltransferase